MGMRLQLGMGLAGAKSVGAPNQAPIDIAWAGDHSTAEDTALGTTIGGALSFVDPDEDETGIFSLVDDSDGYFIVDGTSVKVARVLDYELATSHDITVRFTDSGGASYDEQFTVTVTDVNENPPPEDPPPPGDIIVEEDEFVNPPISTEVEGGVKFHGKKATGATGKFIYDIGAPEANTIYTVQYEPDWSLLANDGVTAFFGFGLKQGNNFHLFGLKGDGSTGLKAYRIWGNNWNQTSGFSTDDGGAAQAGTQAGPNWLQFEISADGTTVVAVRSSEDSIDWFDEYTDVEPLPHDDVVGDYPTFGLAVFMESADAGPFSVKIGLWRTTPRDVFLLSGDMSDGDDRLLLSGDMTDGDDRLLVGDSSGTPAIPLRVTQVYAEAIVVQASSLRVTQVYAEAIHVAHSDLRVTQVYVEVIMAT